MVMEITAPVQPAARVGGKMLSEMTGKFVCLMGKASEPSSDGRSFKLQTTDGTMVLVMLNEPLNTYVDGLVEVVGSVRNEGIHCQEYIVFTEEQTKSFDFTQYNAAVELINKHPGFYPLVQEQQDMQM